MNRIKKVNLAKGLKKSVVKYFMGKIN
jgi:hypothetical protein